MNLLNLKQSPAYNSTNGYINCFPYIKFILYIIHYDQAICLINLDYFIKFRCSLK